MRKLILPAATAAALLLTGCEFLRDHQDDIKAQIISYVENQGREKAEQYVDDLVEQGKLTEKQAELIKDAIPYGVAKVKEVLE